jgi:TetR/AcrR family transcriptional regulator, transcriptional repressor of aconitase
MPKVSAAHRQERRDQILNAARRCFRRRGFHATSMQDLFREAEMSSGAFYLHFPSKDELIVAIAEDNMHDVLVMIRTHAERQTSETVGSVLAAAIGTVIRQNERDGLAGLAVHVWAEALINPVVADRLRALLDQLRQDLNGIASKTGHGDQEAMATVFLALLPGLILQLALFGPGSMSGVEDALSELFAESPVHLQ